MNTGDPQYWSAEYPFVDLVKSNGTIRAIGPDGGWADPEGLIQLDRNGFPVDVPHGITVVILLGAGGMPHFPAGPLACAVSPGWDVRLIGDAHLSHQSGDRFQIDFDGPPKNNLAILLSPKKDHASLTLASCLMPGGTAAEGPFNPAFLADMKAFRVLRFMDWMKTNNASKRLWAERTTPASLSQAGDRGVALEYMVDLANQLGSDPWFTLPLDADDDYYRDFATYVRDHLKPGLKAYVELSNEVWNAGFQQGRDAHARGMAAGYSTYDNLAYAQYYGRRVKALMQTWTDVFGGSSRLVRVVSSQAVNPGLSDAILAVDGLDKVTDALAIAPYFGVHDVGPLAPGESVAEKAIEQSHAVIDQDIKWALEHKAIAAKHRLRLITYEGGADYSAFTEPLRSEFVKLNSDPRIGALYHEYLDRWRREVGDTIMLFDGISTPGNGGTFGHKTYAGQPLSEAPKMAAVVAEIGRLGHAVRDPSRRRSGFSGPSTK